MIGGECSSLDSIATKQSPQYLVWDSKFPFLLVFLEGLVLESSFSLTEPPNPMKHPFSHVYPRISIVA